MLTDPSAAPTMQTLGAPGQGWVVNGSVPRDQNHLTACLLGESCTSADANVTPVAWGPDRITYRVGTRNRAPWS